MYKRCKVDLSRLVLSYINLTRSPAADVPLSSYLRYTNHCSRKVFSLTEIGACIPLVNKHVYSLNINDVNEVPGSYESTCLNCLIIIIFNFYKRFPITIKPLSKNNEFQRPTVAILNGTLDTSRAEENRTEWPTVSQYNLN